MGGAISVEESAETEETATGATSDTIRDRPVPSPPVTPQPTKQHAEEDLLSRPKPRAASTPAALTPTVDLSAPLLATSLYGSHNATLKGEDGLRVERVTIGGEPVVVAMVVDGHSGHEAAALAIDDLVELVAEEARGDAAGDSLCSAARRAFARLHKQLHDSPDPGRAPGASVTLCLLNELRAELSVCNVGDTCALLLAKAARRWSTPMNSRKNSINSKFGADVRGRSPWVELTQNHRLQTSHAERERVRQQGGIIGQACVNDAPAGPLRAYPGGVCCARGIGDRDCGPFISPEVRDLCCGSWLLLMLAAHVLAPPYALCHVPCSLLPAPCRPTVWILLPARHHSQPFTAVYPFPPVGAALVIASDGVWDALSYSTVRNVVLNSKDPQHAVRSFLPTPAAALSAAHLAHTPCSTLLTALSLLLPACSCLPAPILLLLPACSCSCAPLVFSSSHQHTV